MNVIIANERQNELSNLDIDIIKSMTGCFDAQEIVSIFKNFYFIKKIYSKLKLIIIYYFFFCSIYVQINNSKSY